MGETTLSLLGVGHHHPPNVLDNAFLESLDINISEEWILRRVGIRTRRTALPLDYIRHTRNVDPREAESAALYDGVEMAARAARMAFSRAGVGAEDVGMVICGTSSPAYGAPAVATAVGARLGITAPAFDVNSACTSFAAHAHVLTSMAATLPDIVLSVLPENLTKAVDYRDRNTAVLMGDGAAACVWSSKIPGSASVCGTILGSDPARWQRVHIRAAGFLRQDGPSVHEFAVKKTVELMRSRVDCGDVFIGHQANLRMLDRVVEALQPTAIRHLYNVDRMGNCGAAGAASVLSEHWDCLMRESATVQIGVVGAGLSWGAVELRYARK